MWVSAAVSMVTKLQEADRLSCGQQSRAPRHITDRRRADEKKQRRARHRTRELYGIPGSASHNVLAVWWWEDIYGSVMGMLSRPISCAFRSRNRTAAYIWHAQYASCSQPQPWAGQSYIGRLLTDLQACSSSQVYCAARYDNVQHNS